MTGAIVPLISVPSDRQSHGEFSAMDRNTRWVSQGLNPSYELERGEFKEFPDGSSLAAHLQQLGKAAISGPELS